MTFYERLLKETEAERAQLMQLPLIQQGGQGNISLRPISHF